MYFCILAHQNCIHQHARKHCFLIPRSVFFFVFLFFFFLFSFALDPYLEQQRRGAEEADHT